MRCTAPVGLQSAGIDRGQRAQIGQKMAQAMQALKLREGDAERQGPPPGRMQPPPQARRSPAEDPGFNPDSWIDDGKTF